MVTLSGQWCTVACMYPLLAHYNTVEYTVSEVVQAGHGNIHLAAKNELFLRRCLRGRQEISYLSCTLIKIKIV